MFVLTRVLTYKVSYQKTGGSSSLSPSSLPGIGKPGTKASKPRSGNGTSSRHLARQRVGALWYERPPKDFKKVTREGPVFIITSPSLSPPSLFLSLYHSTTSVSPSTIVYLSLSLSHTIPRFAEELFPCRSSLISAAAVARSGKVEKGRQRDR